ncbi:MAG: iron-sulfur cluster insertion protein ErpA [Candidatus Tectomicrobia bacterium]|nr:iron-sulfur cluster insertion protein ErpA [Candidatus Tectomicrobia bacterium]
MISVTEKAVTAVKKIIQEQNNPELKLRMGVKGGGCSGLSYTLNLDTKADAKDKAFEFDGLTVVVDPKSLLFLNGTTLDYVDDVMGGGFKFENPSAKTTCGCGSSFAA